MNRFLALLTTVVSAAALSLSAGSPAHAAVEAPAQGYGFAQGAAQIQMSAADLNRELDAVSKTGGEWLRVMIDWATIERTRGTYDWTIPDRVIGSARAHNLKVLSLVLTTPSWARRGGALGGVYAPPADPATIGPFYRALINRYPDVTRHEVWNEPNLQAFWGMYKPNAAEYTALLKASYTAIKAAQPSSTVVAGGLSPDAGAANFVKGMYAAGAKNYFDAAAMHPYVFPRGVDSTPNGWSELTDIRAVMVANGDSGATIWLTEMGAATINPTGDTGSSSGSLGSIGFGADQMVTQQEQAAEIVDVLRAAARSGYCGPAFIYSVRDYGTAANNREDNFGALLTHDWKPKFTASVLAE